MALLYWTAVLLTNSGKLAVMVDKTRLPGCRLPARALTGLRPSPTSHAVVTSGVGAPVGQDDP
jgi:hypothetical protein